MLQSYFTIAWRSLRRQAGYAAINLFGLALGIACFLLAVLFIRHEYSFDTYHPDAERLYRLVALSGFGEKQWWDGTSGDPLPELDASSSDVDKVTRIRRCGTDRIEHDRTWYLDISMKCAESSLFDVLGFELLRGDPGQVLDRPHTAVVTASFAERLFGDQDPIGRTLPIQVFDTLAAVEITGVMADIPKNTHFTADLFLSRESLIGTPLCLDCGGESIYARMQPGANLEALSARILTLIRDTQGKSHVEDIDFEPITAIHFSSMFAERQGDSRYVWLLSAIALIVLLIACANYMNLATARAMNRRREVGLRKVVGAHRTQLMRQFLVEALLLAALALPVAMLFLFAALPTFNTLAETDVRFVAQADLQLLGIVSAIVLLVGLFAGSYPALFLSRFSQIAVLHGSMAAGASGARLRKVLVVAQFTATIAMFAGTFIVREQLAYVREKNLGFDADQVVLVSLTDRALMEQYEVYREQIAGVAGVRSATAGTGVPGMPWFGGNRLAIHPFGKDQAPVTLRLAMIDDAMLETMNISLLAGRNIPDTEPVFMNMDVIVNMATVRAMQWASAEDAIGKPIDTNMHVVGVIPDIHFASLHQAFEPLLLQPIHQKQAYTIAAKLEGGSIEQTIEGMERVWEATGTTMPFEYRFLDEEINALYAQEQRAARIFSLFSFLAVMIACMGLLGLAAFAAAQRTKEIGIRRVLGATGAHIVRLLTTDYVKLILIAAVLAVPLAYYAAERWLEAFAFHIDIAPGPFLAAGIVALLVALFTTGLQAYRATRTDPVESLRHE